MMESSFSKVNNMDKIPMGGGVVLYGAGNNLKNAVFSFEKRRIPILCICDCDPLKQGKKFFGYSILSIDEVKKYMKDFVIYVTVDQPLESEIINWLLQSKHFREEQFLNSVKNKKYKSCPSIESEVAFTPKGLNPCCWLTENKLYVISEPLPNPAETAKLFLERKANLIRANQREDAPCRECPNLQEGFWNDEKKIKAMNFAAFGICQMRCSYCVGTGEPMRKEPMKVEEYNRLKYDYISIAKYLIENNHCDSLLTAVHGNGEISILPERRELFAFLEEFDIVAHMYTNAAIYEDGISRLLKRGSANKVNVSLDSGTKETFEKIKGRDFFEQVVCNIEKYRCFSENIELKYIILPENANDADIYGFIHICKKMDIKFIQISYDANRKNDDVLEEWIVGAALKLAESAYQNGIHFEIFTLLGRENCRYVKETLLEKGIVY